MTDRGQKVLVVDDERTIADTLALILRAKAYDAQAVYSTEEARKIVADWVPDLVISDVVLPRMSGIEFAVRLKDDCPNCRLLLISGQVKTAEILDEFEAQGHHFDILAKPVHPEELLKVVSKLLADEIGDPLAAI